MIIVAASPQPTALLHDTKSKTGGRQQRKKQSQRHHDQRDLTSHSIPPGGAERSEHPRNACAAIKSCRGSGTRSVEKDECRRMKDSSTHPSFFILRPFSSPARAAGAARLPFALSFRGGSLRWAP